jgi:hypothetical protein
MGSIPSYSTRGITGLVIYFRAEFNKGLDIRAIWIKEETVGEKIQ